MFSLSLKTPAPTRPLCVRLPTNSRGFRKNMVVTCQYWWVTQLPTMFHGQTSHDPLVIKHGTDTRGSTSNQYSIPCYIQILHHSATISGSWNIYHMFQYSVYIFQISQQKSRKKPYPNLPYPRHNYEFSRDFQGFSPVSHAFPQVKDISPVPRRRSLRS